MKSNIITMFSVLALSAITKVKYSGNTTVAIPADADWAFISVAETVDELAALCPRPTGMNDDYFKMSEAKTAGYITEYSGFSANDTICIANEMLSSISINSLVAMPIGTSVSITFASTCTGAIGNYTLKISDGTTFAEVLATAAVTLADGDASTSGASEVAAVLMMLLLALFI
jgi:hypothetical protein